MRLSRSAAGLCLFLEGMPGLLEHLSCHLQGMYTCINVYCPHSQQRGGIRHVSLQRAEHVWQCEPAEQYLQLRVTIYKLIHSMQAAVQVLSTSCRLSAAAKCFQPLHFLSLCTHSRSSSCVSKCPLHQHSFDFRTKHALERLERSRHM